MSGRTNTARTRTHHSIDEVGSNETIRTHGVRSRDSYKSIYNLSLLTGFVIALTYWVVADKLGSAPKEDIKPSITRHLLQPGETVWGVAESICPDEAAAAQEAIIDWNSIPDSSLGELAVGTALIVPDPLTC